MDQSNLSQAHRAIARRLGDRPALRFKRDGRFRDISWSEYRQEVDRVAAGLLARGVRPGDRVAILSENRPEWLVADLAILALGAVDVPLHAPLSPSQVEYQLRHSGARAIIVSNQDQADKVLACRAGLPDLILMVAFDPVRADPDLVVSWDSLKEAETSEEVARLEAKVTRDDPATIIYTSGTTGHPKGVVLSHGNLLSNAETCADLFGAAEDDLQLGWLPLSHIYARTCDHYAVMFGSLTLCLAESMDTILADFREVGATRMNSVPRLYDKVWAAVERLEPATRAAHLRGAFGPTVRQLTSGGAPLSKAVATGYREAGLVLLEGYGQTEASPVITFSHLDAYRIGAVGRALPGVEVRIADDGEILTRGPHVMVEYWKDPEASRAAVVDGWLHTGDVGHLDEDGYLTITDRKKDLIVTSCGKNVAPAMLEGLLTADPYIDQAVIHGDRRPFVTALIVPNSVALESRAAELNCPIERDGELISTPAILDFMGERIGRIMQAVSQPERVRSFLLLGRPLQVDTGELTATLKVRRRQILRAFEDRLEALYAKPSGPVDDQGIDSR